MERGTDSGDRTGDNAVTYQQGVEYGCGSTESVSAKQQAAMAAMIREISRVPLVNEPKDLEADEVQAKQRVEQQHQAEAARAVQLYLNAGAKQAAAARHSCPPESVKHDIAAVELRALREEVAELKTENQHLTDCLMRQAGTIKHYQFLFGALPLLPSLPADIRPVDWHTPDLDAHGIAAVERWR